MRTLASTTRTTENAPAHLFDCGWSGEVPNSAPFSEPFADLSVQRKATCACGGGCPDCQSKLPIQTKFSISEPGNIFEQEADRVAEQVMRIPEPNNKALSDQQSAISNKCETVQMKPG